MEETRGRSTEAIIILSWTTLKSSSVAVQLYLYTGHLKMSSPTPKFRRRRGPIGLPLILQIPLTQKKRLYKLEQTPSHTSCQKA